jgi:uncharacterized hydrophobic protein (TIGR00341 family)
MKRIEVTIDRGIVKQLERSLLEADIPYVISGNEKNVAYTLVVPDQMVNDLLKRLSDSVDLRRKENMITVCDVVASVSPYLEKLAEKSRSETPTVNPLEAIIQPLNKFLRPNMDLVLMVALATIIAFAGLFLDNVAIIIGAMLLSPILGPINAVAVNACLGKARHALAAEASTLILVGLSIGLAAALTSAVSMFAQLNLTSQILLRTHVTIIDVAIAFLLGVAGALALVTAIPEVLVGVAVAVALIPPTAVTGITLALGDFALFRGALILTFTNLFGLKVGAIPTLLLRGISPRHYYEKKKANVSSLYALIIFGAVLAILIALVFLT